MSVNNNPEAGHQEPSTPDHRQGGATGGAPIDRRSFTAWLLAAPFMMKYGLATAATGASTAIASEPADPLCYASVDELKALFKAGKASPVDLLKAQIKRIEALNPKINCITYSFFDQALKDAKQSEERYRNGTARPLEGITVALKDEVGHLRSGWRTTQGSLIFKDSPPATENGPIVDMLEAAGAIMPFQTTVPELYLFLGASTRAWGTTRNPWNLEWTPGGSSAGSAAALAAGFATLAMGSDMGGSIRIPCSQCGLYGFRPPFGRVASSEIPFSTSGPMARRIDDLVHLQNAIVGPSEKIMAAIRPRLDYPAQYPDISGWRVAVDWGSGIAEIIPSVKEAMLKGIKTLRAAGCIVEEVDCGFSKKDRHVFVHGLMSSSMGTMIEIANANRELLSPYMVEILDQVGALGPRQAEEAEELLERYHRQVQQRVFGRGYRVLLMPTMATPLVGADMFKSRETIKEPWVGAGLGFALTWHWNLLNRYPIVDVPLGVVEDRMPTGMQVIGQTFSDLDPFQFAANWARLQSPLFADGRFPSFS